MADSIAYGDYYPGGETRLTTMVVRMHRFVLAEFNTHRTFSRNSASSLAMEAAQIVVAVAVIGLLIFCWMRRMR